MLNQTFTAQNFRKIFDIQNRKGNYLEGKFFPAIEEITLQIKDVSSEFRSLKKQKSGLSAAEYEDQQSALDKKKNDLQETKETLLSAELEKVAQAVSEHNFRIKLEKVTRKSAKDLYITQKDAASFFALKQLAININKLFKVKQSHRYNVLCQLRTALDDKFPKYIIRTDITNFYESICRKTLLDKIDEASLLTHSSKKMIRQILKDYGAISGATTGQPPFQSPGLDCSFCG